MPQRGSPQPELITYLIGLGEKQRLNSSGAVNSITQQLRLRNDIATLGAVETQLRSQSNAALRYIGFQTLIVVSASIYSWQDEMGERLEAYRGDTDLLVASAAQFYFPPK